MPIVKKEPKPQKIADVAELKELLDVSTLILTDFQGLDVKSLSELRGKLREAGVGYRVVKNTLFKLAAADTAAMPLTEGLVGSTAIVYTNDDPVAAAKAVKDATKGPKGIKVKSGLVDGHVMTVKEINALADIPPKEQLYAMVVGGLQSPITGLVGTMQQMISQLVFTLQGVADKKQAA